MRACSQWTWIGWLSVVVLALLPGTLRAHDLSYHYVSIDAATVPANLFFFNPITIADDGRVYGSACYNPDCATSYIAFYEDGVVTVTSAEGFPTSVNARGVIGGAVTIDRVNDIARAAIYRNGKTEIIPPQPQETFAAVKTINDRGDALIESFDAEFNVTYVLYSRGRTTPLNLGPDVATPQFKGMRVLNNHGVLAGVQGDQFVDARGFRYDTRREDVTRLDPRPTEVLSWAMGINNRGDVLGYSFSLATAESAYVERVGIWDKRGRFKTYYVADRSSESLIFNDDNLIVVSNIKDSEDSYIIPAPGEKLNLTEVVRDLPPNTTLGFVLDMNNHGDMIGGGSGGSFLLQRCGRH